MEYDNEIQAGKNSYDFGARMYNNRLGRFFATDLYMNSFAFQSPYIFAGNSVINSSDFEGKYRIIVNIEMTNSQGDTERITVIFKSSNPHIVKLKNQTTGETMNIKFKTKQDGRGGTSMEILEKNYSNKINDNSIDTKEILGAKFGNFSVTGILDEVLKNNSDIHIVIIGNDGISGSKRWGNVSRDQLFGNSIWKKEGEDGTLYESYYYRSRNGERYVIVHFDGTEEEFDSRADQKDAWDLLEEKYTLERAQTVKDEFFPETDADVKSRYSLGNNTSEIEYKKMELLPASRDAVGITIGFDLTQRDRNTNTPNKRERQRIRNQKSNDGEGKSKNPRWL